MRGWRGDAPYKLLSILLQYPGDDMERARADLLLEARQGPSRDSHQLAPFMAHLETTPWTRVRQEYVETFDLQRRCSLYLTYFTHGDTRRRGQELLRLKWLYRAAGLVLEDSELPDYLPVMLEFAALAPSGVGRQLLSEHRAGLELLWLRLQELQSPYAHLVQAVRRALPPLAARQLEAVRRLALEGPPVEEVGLQAFAPPEVMPTIGARW